MSLSTGLNTARSGIGGTNIKIGSGTSSVDISNLTTKTYVDSAVIGTSVQNLIDTKITTSISGDITDLIDSSVSTAIASVSSSDTTSLGYFPRVVDTIQTSNISNPTSAGSLSGSSGDIIVLTAQTTSSENGVYEIQGDTTSAKESDPSINVVYITQASSSRQALYLKDSDTFKRVYFDVFNIYYTLSTSSTSQTNIFDIPCISGRNTECDISISGYHTSDKTKYFNYKTRRIYFNDSETFRDMGNFPSYTKIGTGFTSPTITFSTGTTQSNLKITAGDSTATTWIVKGIMSL